MTNEITYIFFHIPKTGGTSYRVHFQKHLIDQLEFIHLSNKGNKWAKEKELQLFNERDQIDRDKAQVILGHNVCFETKKLLSHQSIREIVFFREPIKWEISRYNQMMNRRVKHNLEIFQFEEWVKQIEKCHSQFDWFLQKYLKLKNLQKIDIKSKYKLLTKTLDGFKYVCFTDQIQSFGEFIFGKLNIDTDMLNENVVGIHKTNYFEKTDSNLKLLEELCNQETQTYKKIRDLYYQPFGSKND